MWKEKKAHCLCDSPIECVCVVLVLLLATHLADTDTQSWMSLKFCESVACRICCTLLVPNDAHATRMQYQVVVRDLRLGVLLPGVAIAVRTDGQFQLSNNNHLVVVVVNPPPREESSNVP